MRGNVDTCNVGDKLLIPIFLLFEDHTLFSFLPRTPKMLGAVEDAQLKRHVESRKFRFGVEVHTGKVVDSITAPLNNLYDGIKSKLRGVINFQRAAWNEACVQDCEHTCPEHVQISTVKWTVDKYLIVVANGLHVS